MAENRNKLTEEAPHFLSDARLEIDAMDYKIVTLLAARQALVQRIQCWKKSAHLPSIDRLREQKLIGKLKQVAMQHALPEQVLEDIYQILLRAGTSKQP